MRKIIVLQALLALVTSTAVAAPNKAKMKGKGAQPAQAQPTEEEAAEADEKAELEKYWDKGAPKIPGVSWTHGPAKGDLGNATIDVPKGYAFTGRSGTVAFLKATDNIPGSDEKGMLWKERETPDAPGWFAIFEYEDSGHVKDDDKDDLDADEMIKTITENNEAANEERQKMGVAPLHVRGWFAPPHYDDATHNVEWGTRNQEEGAEKFGVNYNVRLLGRTGVMSAVLVAGEERMAGATPEFKEVLKGYAYKAGDTYAEYKQGDKLAAYGIAGLVAGGGLAVAAKAGLFSKLGPMIAKLGKLIVVGVLAVGAAIAKFFKGLFGGSKKDPPAAPQS